MTEIPFGYVQAGKIFRREWGEYPEREIGEVRDDDIEKSTAFFVEKFADLSQSIDQITETIDQAENQGSYLMKLIHLKEHLPEHDGLGDYSQLLSTLLHYEKLIRSKIDENRARNSAIKDALIDEADELEEIVSWKEATEKAHDLKARWIKTGNVEEHKHEELETAFWNKISTFFERKKQFYEDKQRLTDYWKRKYEELVVEAENLSKFKGKERFDRVKELKTLWKENGGIPSPLYQPLHDAFYKALKGDRVHKSQPPTSLEFPKILERLRLIKLGESPYDHKELSQLKKTIFKDRSRSEEKSQVLHLLPLLIERDFILKLANKRFPDFVKMEKDRKEKIKRSIIKDLIQRDSEDLKIYEENSAKFSSSDGSMNKLVEGKIRGQKKKIAVKTELLNWIESGNF